MVWSTPSRGACGPPRNADEEGERTWNETKVEWVPDLRSALAMNCGFVAAKLPHHAY